MVMYSVLVIKITYIVHFPIQKIIATHNIITALLLHIITQLLFSYCCESMFNYHNDNFMQLLTSITINYHKGNLNNF